MKLDRFDIEILKHLRADARISWAKLGEQVNLSSSAVQRRAQALQQSGAIHHFTAVVNPKATGQDISAFIQVKIARHDSDAAQQFRHAVLSYHEVESCHQVTGGADFILFVNTRDIGELARFLEKKILYLASVTDATSSIVLRNIKEHGLPMDSGPTA